MNTPEAMAVHIDTLYKKIAELQADCEKQHKAGLDATLRVHARMDDFVKVLGQISEVNKDVQALTTHQKALDSDHRDVKKQVEDMNRCIEMHSGTIAAVHKLAWGVAAFVSAALATAVFKLIIVN